MMEQESLPPCAAGHQVFRLDAPARVIRFTVSLSMRITSPSPMWYSWAIFTPLTEVPFPEPRSVTVSASGVPFNRACCRLMAALGSTRSAPAPRPITTLTAPAATGHSASIVVPSANWPESTMRLSRTGPGSVASPVSLAAYRIIQEALTNAAKHGSGTATTSSLAIASAWMPSSSWSGSSSSSMPSSSWSPLV